MKEKKIGEIRLTMPFIYSVTSVFYGIIRVLTQGLARHFSSFFLLLLLLPSPLLVIKRRIN